MQGTPAVEDGTILASVPKNDRETILIRDREYRGYQLIDVRIFVPRHEELIPTNKGFALRRSEFPKFAAAITRAVQALAEGE